MDIAHRSHVVISERGDLARLPDLMHQRDIFRVKDPADEVILKECLTRRGSLLVLDHKLYSFALDDRIVRATVRGPFTDCGMGSECRVLMHGPMWNVQNEIGERKVREQPPPCREAAEVLFYR
jgi:hypothetical protein